VFRLADIPDQGERLGTQLVMETRLDHPARHPSLAQHVSRATALQLMLVQRPDHVFRTLKPAQPAFQIAR